MFSKEYSFRYGDLDNKFNIKISTVLDILQDISILHSDFVGFSLEKLYSMNIAWLLKGWRIRFLSKLDFNNSITVKTGIMSLEKLIELMVINPRKRFNIPMGNDFSLWDTEYEFEVDECSHNFSGIWKQNSVYHWQECDLCGFSTDVSNHSFKLALVEKAPTESEDGSGFFVCEVCGILKEMTIAAGTVP